MDTSFSVFTYHGRPRNLALTNKLKSQQTLVVLVEFLFEFLRLTYDLPTTTTHKTQAFTSKARSTANLPGAVCIYMLQNQEKNQSVLFISNCNLTADRMYGGWLLSHPPPRVGVYWPFPRRLPKGPSPQQPGWPSKAPPQHSVQNEAICRFSRHIASLRVKG